MIKTQAGSDSRVPGAGGVQAVNQPHPPEVWQAEYDLRQSLEASGYKIRMLKATENGYEVTGDTPGGKRVRLFMDPVSGVVQPVPDGASDV